jgi:hypothetical protein
MEAIIKEQLIKLIKDKLTIPSNIEELNKVIELKNKLTKQLNNLYSKIESINNIINPIENLIPKTKTGIQIAQTAIDTVSFIPSTAVTPIPVGPILAVQKVINLLRNLIGKGEGKIGEGTSLINLLLNKLQTVIDLLAIVDIAISESTKELGETTINQESISKQLLDSTQQQDQQLSPVINNFNGFDLSVVPVEGSKVGTIKQRQAIAKNQSGIIMLRGEASFSSNDQILIDELVFYIKQNNLSPEGFSPIETPSNSSPSLNLSSITTSTISSGGGRSGGY